MMTSRERVAAAFARRKADKVPVDYSATPLMTERMFKHLNCKDYYALLDVLDTDFRRIHAPYTGKPLFPELPSRIVEPVYGFYTKWVEHKGGGYWDFCDFPLQDADSQMIAEFPVPDPDDFDYSFFEDTIKLFKNRAISVGDPGETDLINATGRVRGMENTLINLQTGGEVREVLR